MIWNVFQYESRNYSIDGMKGMTTNLIIKYVYESETAFFYFYQGCTLIDVVIPLRFKIDSKIEFVPVIVSTIIAPSYVVLLGIFISKVQ